jgi:DNA-binding XRE family transcriptional regulator
VPKFLEFALPFESKKGRLLLPVAERDMLRFGRYLNEDSMWTGRKNVYGYGVFRLGGRQVFAHRLIWQSRNPRCIIPVGFQIDHINFDLDDLSDKNLRCIPTSANYRHKSPYALARSGEFLRAYVPKNTGENSPGCKVTDANVNLIKILYSTGKYTQAQLGLRFNVSQQLISFIVNGKLRSRPTPKVK